MKILNRFLNWWLHHKKPSLVVPENLEEDTYLIRWHLIPMNRVMNIYLHLFLRSDRDVEHDHPWDNISIILKGFYMEQSYGKSVLRTPFKPVFRTAETSHRLILDEPVWSLFITGPKRRSWGFYAPKGWTPWREFLKLKEEPR